MVCFSHFRLAMLCPFSGYCASLPGDGARFAFVLPPLWCPTNNIYRNALEAQAWTRSMKQVKLWPIDPWLTVWKGSIENPGKVLCSTMVCEIPFQFYVKRCKPVAKENDSSSSFYLHQVWILMLSCSPCGFPLTSILGQLRWYSARILNTSWDAKATLVQLKQEESQIYCICEQPDKYIKCGYFCDHFDKLCL